MQYENLYFFITNAIKGIQNFRCVFILSVNVKISWQTETNRKLRDIVLFCSISLTNLNCLISLKLFMCILWGRNTELWSKLFVHCARPFMWSSKCRSYQAPQCLWNRYINVMICTCWLCKLYIYHIKTASYCSEETEVLNL